MKLNAGQKICDCDQAAEIERRGRPCKHWEKLIGIGVNSGRDRNTVVDRNPERFVPPVMPEEEYERLEKLALRELEPEELIDDETALRLKLENAGLPARKCDVLVLRLCRGLTFKEIADLLGYAQTGGAAQAYLDAVHTLKRGNDETV